MGEKLARLARENFDLRRKLDTANASQAVTIHRADETEQRLRDLSEHLLAAQRRADAAEHRLDELSSAYAALADGVRHRTPDLHAPPDRMPSPAARSFRDALAVAQRSRAHSPAHRPTDAGSPAPRSRGLWTA